MEDYITKISENEQIPEHIRETVCDEMYHALEVSNLAYMIACELGQDKEFCENVMIAGVLHDIGKMKLAKYLYLEEDETMVVEQIKYVRLHSTFSYYMLKDEDYPDDIAYAVYHHHENYDGSGYPDNLRGDSIPLMSRILRTCDVFAALTSDRTYRKAFDEKSALEIMIDEVKDYDMEVFLAFQRILHSEAFKGMAELRNKCCELQMKHMEMFEKAVLSY